MPFGLPYQPALPQGEATQQPQYGGGEPSFLSQFAPAMIAGGAGLGALLTGGDTSFALSGLAKGFADQQLSSWQQQEGQKRQQQDMLLKEAHSIATELQEHDLQKIDPDGSRFAGVRRLSDKYRQALAKPSPGGSIITPAEAAELVALGGVAKNELQQIKQIEAQQEQVRHAQAAEEAKYQSMAPYIMAPPPQGGGSFEAGGYGGNFPEAEPDSPEGMDLRKRDIYGQARAAEFQGNIPTLDPAHSDWGPLTSRERVSLMGQQNTLDASNRRAEATEAAAGKRADATNALIGAGNARSEAATNRQMALLMSQEWRSKRNAYAQELRDSGTVLPAQFKALMAQWDKENPSPLSMVPPPGQEKGKAAPKTLRKASSVQIISP